MVVAVVEGGGKGGGVGASETSARPPAGWFS